MLAGNGKFEARGGNASQYSGGGGGGRIAVYYMTNTFAGTAQCSVAGGSKGACYSTMLEDGASGTLGFFDTSASGCDLHVSQMFRIEPFEAAHYGHIWLEDGGDLELCSNSALTVESPLGVPTNSTVRLLEGSLLHASNGVVVHGGGTLYLERGSVANDSGNLVFEPGCTLALQGATQLTITNSPILAGINIIIQDDAVLKSLDSDLVLDGTQCSLRNGAALEPSGGFTINNNSSLTIDGSSRLEVEFKSLRICSNSVIWCEGACITANVHGVWAGKGVTIAAGNIDIDETSRISADGLGYQPLSGGPGEQTLSFTGGGYGGRGGSGQNGAKGGVAYGSAMEPRDLGSPSQAGSYVTSAGAGGGAIELIAEDELCLDGAITANGNDMVYNAYAGGGAGGSILIRARRLVGHGSLTARCVIYCFT